MKCKLQYLFNNIYTLTTDWVKYLYKVLDINKVLLLIKIHYSV